MIDVSKAHQATDTAETDSASSLYHDYVSSHFYHFNVCVAALAQAGVQSRLGTPGANSPKPPEARKARVATYIVKYLLSQNLCSG